MQHKRLGWQMVLGVGLVLCAASVTARPHTPRLPYTARSRTVRVPVVANGVRLPIPALMLKDAGRTMLPMRAIFTALGAQVVWNAQEQAVYAWKTDGTGVRFALGATRAQSVTMPGLNERAQVLEERRLTTPATMVGNRVYIPIRAASELLGADVRWVNSDRTVYVGTNIPPVAADTGGATTTDPGR